MWGAESTGVCRSPTTLAVDHDRDRSLMSETLDVVVLGMGPGGEVAASALLAAGRKVAVVERELIGEEFGYWACIPSKTLLRPP